MMCDECGCGKPAKVIKIDRSVNEANDIIADQVGSYLHEKGILGVNIMGSPGSGKTTIIEGLLRYLDADEIAVIQGDLESDVDKRRVEKLGVYCHQINTHSGCHLNASMINRALMDMDLEGKKILFIENVGNLVCPAGVQLGQGMNIVVSSTAEGSDKPRKYPIIFRDADMIVISKTDISAAVGFEEESYISDLKKINDKALIVKVSSKEPSSYKEIASEILHEREHLLGHHHTHH